MTIPNVIPSAACQRGRSGGQLKANNTDDTKKPSLTSCFLMIANKISHEIPTKNVVA